MTTKTHKRLLALASGAALMAMASPANAELLNFSLTGSYTANWQLDSDPNPNSSSNSSFTINNVAGNFPGSNDNIVNLTFYTTALLGGFFVNDAGGAGALLSTQGPQLFTGAPADPTFLRGTFALTQLGGPGVYSLTIAPAGQPAVPEPASWAMMIGGFGLIGGAMRRANVRVAYA